MMNKMNLEKLALSIVQEAKNGVINEKTVVSVSDSNNLSLIEFSKLCDILTEIGISIVDNTYTDDSIKNIQVKHTDEDNNMTFSSLESSNNKPGMLETWAAEWNKFKTDYKIRSLSIVTNRKWGPNARDGKCSFSRFINNVLPRLKNDLSYCGENILEKNAIKWFRKTINLNENDTNEFIQIIDFKNQEDLAGLEVQIKDLLSKILGTDKLEVINTAIDRLRSSLEKWATSRREKPEITKEDIYRVLCDPHYILPEYKLSPETPILPSRRNSQINSQKD